MMTSKMSRFSVPRRLRWVLAPILAFLALSAWAFASPIGAAPDDDYHLVSIWCAGGGSEYCSQATPDGRVVARGFDDLHCYVQVPQTSAECQQAVWPEFGAKTMSTQRGNFYGEYPKVYYATMRLFAGTDVEASALTMRIVNVAIFVGLATSLAILLPVTRRRTLLLGWLVTLVPLGMFLIPSNNPSGWAITGVGTAFLALLGWFEATGNKRWGLAALYIVGVLMAGGARGDAAVYALGATVTVLMLTVARDRRWVVSAILPGLGIMLAVILLSTAAQAGVGATGFSDSTGAVTSPTLGDPDAALAPLGGISLVAYNLLMLPFLWTGVWGTWGLGWLDTSLPAIVPWAAAGAFVAVSFVALSQLNWRKVCALLGVFAVLVALPTYVLSAGGDKVGANLQPRYVLPLIVLFGFLLLVEPAGRVIQFSRVQTGVILGALFIANLVALQVNIRRYVTGDDQQGFNLDAGKEWWWSWLPVGPLTIWIIGLSWVGGLLVVLWPALQNAIAPSSGLAPDRTPSRAGVDVKKGHPAPQIDEAPV